MTQQSNGWMGIDFDGTLVHYDGWVSETHIGEPIEPMMEHVRTWLAHGIEVRIVTARARDADMVYMIRNWTEDHFGVRLQVTDRKDFRMITLLDDRATQVIKNTGELLEDRFHTLVSLVNAILDPSSGHPEDFREVMNRASQQLEEWDELT